MHIVQIRSRKLGFVSIEWSVDRAEQEMPWSNDHPEYKNHVSELKYIAERENEDMSYVRVSWPDWIYILSKTKILLKLFYTQVNIKRV